MNIVQCINTDVPNIDKIRKYDPGVPMAGMKRFVTYIYAYEEKQKRNNVGFAKVEIRGEDCRLEIHLRGIYSRNGECRVYLMRQEGHDLVGFLIGKMKIMNGGGDFGTAFRAGQIRTFPYGIYDMEGLFLLSEDERVFASRWKDGGTVTIDRSNFRVWNFEGAEQPDIKESGQRGAESPNQPTAGEPVQPQPEEPPVQSQSEEPPMQPQSEGLPVQLQETEATANPDSPVQPLQDVAQEGEGEDLSATEIPMRNVFPRHDWSAVWEMLKKNHPLFAPFDDESICCMQIELKDLRDLPKKYWYLGNNSFLLHGFFNYHYLVLGNIEKNRWFIGIPGIYQRQERAMAAIFGFPEFLPAATKEKADIAEEPVNRFGYWYRFIEE